MNIDPLLVAELLSLGLVSGFLAGLLGIGGGMIMVPFMTFILTSRGYPAEHVVKMAVATSLATICFTSMSSVRAHHQRGAVLWPVALAGELRRALVEDMSEKDMAREIKRLEKQMLEHARNLEFEQAAKTRDQLAQLKKRVFGATGTDPLGQAA